MEFESYLSGDLLSAPEEKSRGLYMIARGTVRVRSDEFLHIEQLLTDVNANLFKMGEWRMGMASSGLSCFGLGYCIAGA